MRRAWRLVMSGLSIALLCVCEPSAQAQSDDSMAELQQHVERLREKQQGEVRGLTQSAPQKLADGMQDVQRALQVPQSTATQDRQVDMPRTHIRASEGVPFPKAEEVVLPPPPPLPPFPTSALVENLPKPEYKKPPRCDDAHTVRHPLPQEYGSAEEVVMSDTLYLPEDLVPVDPMEVLGSKVVMHPYGPKSGEGIYVRMFYDAVPCLPYRIRYTNKARYYDRGNAALKNYDKDPSGRGAYHSVMQHKLFLGK